MRCFWPEASTSYNELMVHDAMFPPEGQFYTNHRHLSYDLAELERLDGLGCLPLSSAGPAYKRFRRGGEASTSEDRPHAPGRAGPQGRQPASSRPPPPAFNELGSFAYAVKEDESSVTISGVKYAKAPILQKLGLREEDICLPCYLSWKGAAACPKAGQTGHEATDSVLHVFSESAVALRPSFDQSPYRLPSEPFNARRGRGRGRGVNATSTRGRIAATPTVRL